MGGIELVIEERHRAPGDTGFDWVDREGILRWLKKYHYLFIQTMLYDQSCLTPCDPWMAAHQAPLSVEFSKQEYWCPSLSCA